MNYKRVIGAILLIAGTGLLLYGFHGKQQMAQARADIDRSTQIIPENPVKDIVKGELNKKVDRYRTPVKRLLWGGTALIVIGGILLCFGRTRNKK